jgi:hypothetical protein
MSASSRSFHFFPFSKFLSKAGIGSVLVWIDILESAIHTPYFLFAVQYSFDFTFHNNSCCLYISMKRKEHTRGMDRKSGTILALQSRDLVSDTHAPTCMTSCLYTIADRFASSHAKDSACQISLPTTQHTHAASICQVFRLPSTLTLSQYDIVSNSFTLFQYGISLPTFQHAHAVSI